MPKCPICETKVDNYIETYISKFNNQEYKLYHCPNCDLQWWEPLKMISEFYENETFESYRIFHLGIRKVLEENHRLFFKFLFKDIVNRDNLKILDIGCGDGIFLKTLVERKKDLEVYGIDFDSKSIKIAKQNCSKCNFLALSLEDFMDFAIENKLKFDVITFFEVLEHQDKPKDFLNNIKKLLKPGGFIAGSVPNRNFLFARKLWKYLDIPPHHFLRFSEEALKNTLKYNGFQNILVHPTNFSSESWDAYIEKLLFGNFWDKYKTKFKKFFVKNAQNIYLSVEYIEEIEESRRLELIKFLKYTRKLIFYPVYLYLLLKYGKRGTGFFIYFQAHFL